MAGTSLSMAVSSEQARASLAALIVRGQDLREPFAEIGAYLESSTQQRFLDMRDAEGHAWQPVSARYALRKTRFKRGNRNPADLLRQSGLLFRSITHLADHTSLQVGSNRVYAAIHQLGGTDDMAPGPAGIPARPFLGVSQDDAEEIETILLDYLAEPLR